jgi:hypothetical protein
MDPFPQLADVVLTRGQNKLILAQRLVALGRRVQYTHVMFSLGSDVWIHATLEGGVGIVATSDTNLLDLAAEPPVRGKHAIMALRHKRAAGSLYTTCPGNVRKLDNEKMVQWFEAAWRHTQKRYNIFFGLPKRSRESAFCSELVAQIFKQMGLPLTRRRPYRVFPYHIERLANDPSMSDITPDALDQFSQAREWEKRRGKPDVASLALRDAMNAASSYGLAWTSLRISILKAEFEKWLAAPARLRHPPGRDEKVRLIRDELKGLDRSWQVSKEVSQALEWLERKCREK